MLVMKCLASTSFSVVSGIITKVVQKSISFEKRHTVEEQQSEIAIKVFLLQLVSASGCKRVFDYRIFTYFLPRRV